MAENPQTLPGQPLPTPLRTNLAQPEVKPSFWRRAGQRPKKGDLVRFRYAFWKHDPNPLVLVTAQYSDGRIAGVNLHNLTLLDMKTLVQQYCNKSSISYQLAVKGRKNIVRGFRTYKWEGIKDMIVLNCENFLARLGVVREKKLLSPNEVAKLRLQIQQQLKHQINPRVEDLMKRQPTPTGTIPGKPASVPGIPVGEQPGGE